MFREVCLSDCLNYEYVHIKTGIDIFTRHKANITQISITFTKKTYLTYISCINCNLMTILRIV